jgi:hypothetical protein
MLAGNRGFFGASKKAISAKARARITGIKQTFDPLNIASALVGRSRLGTTLLGKLLGRSAEDITYFAGDRGMSARPIRKFRYKNPLITSISSSDVTPTKRNDGLANIFAKIYNTMVLNRIMQKKQKEIENNFKEELADEDERRHKELIEAIRGRSLVPIVSKDDDKEKDSIFDSIFKQLAELYDFAKRIGKLALKAAIRTGISVAKSAGTLGKKFLNFIGKGSLLRGAGIVGAAIALTDLGLTILEERKIYEAARDGDVKKLRELVADKVTGGDGVEIEEETKEIDQRVVRYLQTARIRSAKPYFILKEIEKTGVIPGSENQTPSEELKKLAEPKMIPDEYGRPLKLPEDDEIKKISAVDTSDSSSTSKTSPMPVASAFPMPVASALPAAVSQNADLQLTEKSGGTMSSPVSVSTNNIVALPKRNDSGIPPVLASVRDDELESPLIDNLRRVAYS